MKITDIHGGTDHQPAPLTDCLRQLLLVDTDPSDSVYQQRYAAEMIEGFRVLSLLTFVSMAVLFVVHLVQPDGPLAATYEGPTSVACALLALAGGVGLLVSKSIRSPNTAFLSAAALNVAAVVVLSVDIVQRVSGDRRSTSSIIPVIFSILLLSAALLPLRPRRVLGLGALLVASSGLAASLMDVPFRADVVDLAAAATVVAVSVVIAARSTSHRIRIHQAHVSAMEAERKANKLNLHPLPQILCRPHGLMVAMASILNDVPDSALPATIDTYAEGADVVVKVARSIPRAERQEDANLAFAVVGGRIRASGWDLFAARQLVRENGGELRLQGLEGLEQVVTITLPTNATLPGQDLRLRATVVA